MKKHHAFIAFILCASAFAMLVYPINLADVLGRREKVVFLTTMGNISDKKAAIAEQEIEAFYGIDVKQIGKSRLPKSAYCSVRNRYVAVEILNDLKQKSIADHLKYNYKVLAITDQDIETEEGKHWGVMGLAFLGGDECVVSTFRLNGSEDRFRKVTLHETGHMLGIKHCTSGIPSCFMNDAKGKGATVDRARIYLCDKCRSTMSF